MSSRAEQITVGVRVPGQTGHAPVRLPKGANVGQAITATLEQLFGKPPELEDGEQWVLSDELVELDERGTVSDGQEFKLRSVSTT